MSKSKAVVKDHVREIVTLHGEIMGAMRVGLDKAIRIGSLLTQERGRLKHGDWLPWVKANLTFTDRTARNYIRVYENRERLILESVSDLGSAYRLIAPPPPPKESKAEQGNDDDHYFWLRHYFLMLNRKERQKFLDWVDEKKAEKKQGD